MWNRTRPAPTGRVVAVTGAAGLVGTACLQALAESGDEVIAIDRRRGSGPGRWRRADLRSLRATRAAMRGATHLIHLAGHTHPGAAPAPAVLEENVAIAANVLEAFSAGSPECATVASTVCVYGLYYPTRQRSPQYLPIDEDHPCAPGDQYSLSKVMIEQLVATWNRQTGGAGISLRFPTVIRDGSPKAASYRRELLADPHSANNRGLLWASVHVDDLADAFARALDLTDGGVHVANVSSPVLPGGLVLSELAGVDHPAAGLRPGLDEMGAFDTTRARDLLGWQPTRNPFGPE